MIVLVAGAHGRLGSRVVALLLRRGQVVRGFVRLAGLSPVLNQSSNCRKSA
jgi:nucleoside-diphosphate-sugar epimerase